VEAAKERGGKKTNFLIALLQQAESEGMKCDTWETEKDRIRVFVELRNHMVHNGLEVSQKLRDRLEPIIESVPEIPGESRETKLDRLGETGHWIYLTREFVLKTFDALEELAACLIYPDDGEEEDYGASTLEFLKKNIWKDDEQDNT